MKKYNIQNYIRYKNDMTYAIAKVEGKFWDEYNRDELIIKFLPLVENLAINSSLLYSSYGKSSNLLRTALI